MGILKDIYEKDLHDICEKAIEHGKCRFTTTGMFHSCLIVVFEHAGELAGNDRLRIRGERGADALVEALKGLVGTPEEANGDAIVAYLAADF